MALPADQLSRVPLPEDPHHLTRGESRNRRASRPHQNRAVCTRPGVSPTLLPPVYHAICSASSFWRSRSPVTFGNRHGSGPIAECAQQRSGTDRCPGADPVIAPQALLMILLVARCLLVRPGTNRQHPALAGIRSRREMRETAACGILRHRLAESNTCCSGTLIRGSKAAGQRPLVPHYRCFAVWRAGLGPPHHLAAVRRAGNRCRASITSCPAVVVRSHVRGAPLGAPQGIEPARSRLWRPFST